ncbi:DUF4843 domain-containing protein [uncultured Sphingobacterium sp.]|uniref:DUF4843 domain-containing protein n=1 Tax=uncultured Sphingobacterium sp. TaxID=182688 RepID=UPI0025F68135|nr:DUF4843 domain-containing protein [uncultured Sphingobacterium sp.]
MKTIQYFIFAGLLLALMACKRQDTILFEGEERISFFIGEYDVDSTSYTFAFDPVKKERDTIYLKMRIQGRTHDRARAIKVKPGAGTTAVLGEDFLFPEVILPADSITINYPIILINTPKMEAQALRIVAEVAASDDFLPGGTGQVIDGTKAINLYKIWVSNKPERPVYWDDAEYYFGSFSATRIRFMISVLGISDFSYDAIGAYGWYTYPVILRNALVKYEATKGPLIDEFGQRVTF